MSISTVGHTALGATAFLALEGIAASVTLNYGFVNAVAAMLVVCLLFHHWVSHYLLLGQTRSGY